MRVTIEATAVWDPARAAGIARYVRNLLGALLDLSAREETGDRYTLAYRLSRRWKPGSPLRAPACRTAWVVGSRVLGAPRAEVFHGPEGRIAARGGEVLVATVHDVIPLLFEEFSSERYRERRRRDFTELARRCRRLVADSEATRRDFLERFDFPPHRIDVVPLGVEPHFHPREPDEVRRVAATYGLDGPYLLFVGELSRRKNLPRLVEAFARSGLGAEFTLALAGAPAHGHEEVRAAIERHGAGRVRMLGRVPDEHLPALYAGARAFAFPTLYEGFGLPVLEAAACGTPVLSSNVGSVPELAPPSAVLVDPHSVEAIEEGLRRVAELGREHAEADRAHAAAYTWERCARATRDVWLHARGGAPEPPVPAPTLAGG